MHLSEEIAGFLTSPVMIVIGTSDRANRPAAGRGLGIAMAGPDSFDLVLSGWQWAETVANIRLGSTLAVTAARPSDYVSYQVKGPAVLRAMDDRMGAVAAAYRADIRLVLGDLGVPGHMIDEWTVDRDPVVARLTVREAYVQTPGARAGTVL